MRLHEDAQLFKEAITFVSRPVAEGGLGISPLFIEKDYWICRSLRLMAKGDIGNRTVFKGGTSLSKAYGIGNRFSEDVDVAIADAWTLSGNQLKSLIRQTAHRMTEGLEEMVIPGKTSKGSHYHKAYYRYPQAMNGQSATSISPGQILIEINSFANPYPCERLMMESFLTTFLRQSGNQDIIADYHMQPFAVMVLDKRRTATEKLVSLMRCSLADDSMTQLSAKIRHFYDLHYLLHDEETNGYLKSDAFRADFQELFEHDRQQFDRPNGWLERSLDQSPLLTAWADVWKNLEAIYLRELPGLAYHEIPSSEEISDSMQTTLGYIGW